MSRKQLPSWLTSMLYFVDCLAVALTLSFLNQQEGIVSTYNSVRNWLNENVLHSSTRYVTTKQYQEQKRLSEQPQAHPAEPAVRSVSETLTVKDLQRIYYSLLKDTEKTQKRRNSSHNIQVSKNTNSADLKTQNTAGESVSLTSKDIEHYSTMLSDILGVPVSELTKADTMISVDEKTKAEAEALFNELFVESDDFVDPKIYNEKTY